MKPSTSLRPVSPNVLTCTSHDIDYPSRIAVKLSFKLDTPVSGCDCCHPSHDLLGLRTALVNTFMQWKVSIRTFVNKATGSLLPRTTTTSTIFVSVLVRQMKGETERWQCIRKDALSIGLEHLPWVPV